jgi:hypothetical protein
MRPLLVCSSVLGLLVTAVGCNPSVSLPRLAGPGPAWFQRRNAVQFDPYPDQDAGPAIEGGRPLDYNRQIPEVERSRFYQGTGSSVAAPNPTSWFSRRGGGPVLPPPPSTTVMPAPGAADFAPAR